MLFRFRGCNIDQVYLDGEHGTFELFSLKGADPDLYYPVLDRQRYLGYVEDVVSEVMYDDTLMSYNVAVGFSPVTMLMEIEL